MKTSLTNRRPRGQVLVGVILVILVLLIMVPAIVQWVQQESRTSVKDRKATTAFNLAEAAVDRGYWKAKSSTGTINMVLAGTVIAGYNFDTTYSDVTGGTYRVKISSAANKSITIVGEGRDSSTKEVRAISAVFQNRTIYSPLLAQGDVNYVAGMCLLWGPMMSQGSITMDATTSQWYFPRKFARANVIGAGGFQRDTTWPLPPNTDNVEWWANYPYVPELPILDFATLRSSAAATNTLNVYGCASSASYTDPATGSTLAGAAPWDTNAPTCPSTVTPHSTHFGNSFNHPKGAKPPSDNPYVWYWDGDLTLTGGNGALGTTVDSGLRGTVIVRGNLTIDSSGDYNYTGPVPVNAWQEHQKLTISANDTAAANEYPADTGFHKTAATLRFGTDPITIPIVGSGFVNTVGIRGFVYVGGNLFINSFMDFNGAIWVNGTVSANCPAGISPPCSTALCGVFYDDTLSVPTLNVILVRQSWQEVPRSTQSWP